ncbi:MAG: hypothetical protein KF819_03955 [Labilithrix sp.]|nr:hypothetical protein [Labilithrix sp.]
MAERRRLPVIQSPPPASDGGAGDDEIEPRPPWHWIGFGTVATFAAWLPLAYGAQAFARSIVVSRFGQSPTREEVDLAFAAMSAEERFRWTASQTLPHVLAFGLAAFGGGYLVGRFGTGTAVKHAAASGVVTSLVALFVSWRVLAEGGVAALVSVVVPLVVAVAFAAWGGRVGVRRRDGKPAEKEKPPPSPA